MKTRAGALRQGALQVVQQLQQTGFTAELLATGSAGLNRRRG